MRLFLQKRLYRRYSTGSKYVSDGEIGSEHQDPLVLQIGICFEKFPDALVRHMTTLGNNISTNMIINLRIDNEDLGKQKTNQFLWAKAIEEDESNGQEI